MPSYARRRSHEMGLLASDCTQGLELPSKNPEIHPLPHWAGQRRLQSKGLIARSRTIVIGEADDHGDGRPDRGSQAIGRVIELSRPRP